MIGEVIGALGGIATGIASAATPYQKQQISALSPIGELAYYANAIPEMKRIEGLTKNLGTLATTDLNTYEKLGSGVDQMGQYYRAPALERGRDAMGSPIMNLKYDPSINAAMKKRYSADLGDELALGMAKQEDADRVLKAMIENDDLNKRLGYAVSMKNLAMAPYLLDIGAGQNVNMPQQDVIGNVFGGFASGVNIGRGIDNTINSFKNYSSRPEIDYMADNYNGKGWD